MNTHSIKVIVSTTLLILIGDSILRLASIGRLPIGSNQWISILGRPEVLNAVVVLVLLGLISAVWGLDRPAIPGVAGVLAVATTAVHRWMVGGAFSAPAMVVTAVIFFVLACLSLFVARAFVSSDHKK